MKKIRIHPLLFLLVIPLLSSIYSLINKAPKQLRTLYTDLDHVIPFMKIFIIPYMIWVPFLYLTLVYFYFKNRKLYADTLITYTISVLICFIIYILFQTTVPRPHLLETDMLSKFVLFVYQNDAPFNCFPSIHVLSSYLLYRAAAKSQAISKSMTMGIGLLAWLIIVSTLFVKQHVVLDVFAGVILAHLVYSLVQRVNVRSASYGRRDAIIQNSKGGVSLP